jgi:hypothetical protein
VGSFEWNPSKTSPSSMIARGISLLANSSSSSFIATISVLGCSYAEGQEDVSIFLNNRINIWSRFLAFSYAVFLLNRAPFAILASVAHQFRSNYSTISLCRLEGVSYFNSLTPLSSQSLLFENTDPVAVGQFGDTLESESEQRRLLNGLSPALDDFIQDSIPQIYCMIVMPLADCLSNSPMAEV